ncbi:MAG: ABC transporter permease [Sphingobacteriaceae bacterium]|nr:ABC transporter permease [Sphingobacteriaceae bacterium]
MNKILLIIQREYLSRVKKKSFIVMTLVTPLLIAAVYGLIGYLSYEGMNSNTDTIAVVSENKHLTEQLLDTKKIKFNYVNGSFEQTKKDLAKADFDYILFLPDFELGNPKDIQLVGSKQPSLALNNKVEAAVEKLIRNEKLKKSGISNSELTKLETSINIDTKKITEKGTEEDSSAGASTIIGSISGILMFMFIMLYGIQVMRGVIEEKTNRIIEVIISSVKPFQLMMGKIFGIALVGLTQFLLWIVLTITISGAAVSLFSNGKGLKENMVKQQMSTLNNPEVQKDIKKMQENTFSKIEKSVANLNLTKISIVFVFFFLGGYLFYSALYAAIGSAVDNETETQQFMMPVMMPLMLGYVLSLSVVNSDPYGNIAFWLSIIPFTSPIAMMVRMPYGVPDWQLALSMVLLIVGFLGTVWMASRIYRVGILMYGKKVTFKEMFKWFSYKN